MRSWHVRYELVTNFSAGVSDHAFVLRCFPYRPACYSIRNQHCTIEPRSRCQWGEDAFGNTLMTGSFAAESAVFRVEVGFDADMNYAAGVPELRPPQALGMFAAHSRFTRPRDNLRAWSAQLGTGDGGGERGLALHLMHELYARFRYVTGSTNVRYDAEQAFSQGCGVCQDYAHILLSLCRQRRLCARYVAGAIPGEGQSHAWIEVLQRDSMTWLGLDPTHDRLCDDAYVPFAVGRDAHDCPLNRGVYLGFARQRQCVSVIMTPLQQEEQN